MAHDNEVTFTRTEVIDILAALEVAVYVLGQVEIETHDAEDDYRSPMEVLSTISRLIDPTSMVQLVDLRHLVFDRMWPDEGRL